MSCGQVFLKAAHAFRFRAAALAAWLCSLHQTLDWTHSQSAVALVLAMCPYHLIGWDGSPSRPTSGAATPIKVKCFV
jgi:hypothetical protein